MPGQSWSMCGGRQTLNSSAYTPDVWRTVPDVAQRSADMVTYTRICFSLTGQGNRNYTPQVLTLAN